MTEIYVMPRDLAISSSNQLLSGALQTFYQTGTTILQAVFSDEACTVELPNPVPSDAAGLFPKIYKNPNAEADYRVKYTTADGVLIWQEDGISRSSATSTEFAITAAETAAGITPVSRVYPEGHVLRYAINATPGTTDMTLAFQYAAQISLNPYAPAGLYLITGSIVLRDNQHWRLEGARISITGTSTQVFTVAAGIDDWSIDGDWSVTGDNDDAGSITGSAAALKIIDSMRFRVSGLTAKNIKGWGILGQPGSSASSRAEHGQIIAPQLYACFIGMEVQAGTGAEYIQTVAPNVSRCNTGVKVAAGNLNVVGGSITDNVDGVSIAAGTNHAHGIFSGTQINHNTQYNVRSDGITTGHFFVGCNIYQGDIYLKQSQGILFKSCTIDVNNYYFEGSQGCGFIDCALPDAYTNTVHNSFNANPSYTIWRNCQHLTGKNDGIDIVGLRVNATSGGISVAAATLAVETTLLLADTSNQSAFDGSQTLFDGYAAGIYTCRGLGNGKVRFSALLNIANNAADSMASMYAYLQKNGSGVQQWFTRMVISTTKTIFMLDCVVEMVDTDTLRIKLGSTVTFGNAISVGATETNVIVEGL